MRLNKMTGFRVSKYDEKHRCDGVYLKNEWTSIGDVGKVFNGKEFGIDEYKKTEGQYLLLIRKLCLKLNVCEMQITDLEDYFSACAHHNGSVLCGMQEILDVIRDCLREKYWCKLSADRLFVHFGYDYYLYIHCPLDSKCMSVLVKDVGLFLEIMDSPYL